MSFDPYGITIGPLTFHYYGLLIMFGAVVGTFVARRIWSQMQSESDPDLVWDALVWALIFGVIGARLYHVFTPSKSLLEAGIDTRYYLTHPIDLIASWQGGLGMPGAIAGGALGLYIFARRNDIHLPTLLDAAGPGLALGHAIGRWGNFVNQELYGPPTDLPWAIYIRPENRLAGFESFEYFHPLFLYEAIWNVGLAIALIWIWRRYGERLMQGDLFLMYLVGYPLGRFLLEFLRIDFVPLLGINFNQMLSLGVAIASAAFIYWRHQSSPSPAREPS
ncbi:MAG: prolipoprotein diacylglyceryl transferase [Anaerolineales bacterium]|nr:prolipoprotein diacylglyceryl transferase [Anaerolineales bacterium]